MLKMFRKKEKSRKEYIDWTIETKIASIAKRQSNISKFDAEGNYDLLFVNHLSQIEDYAGLALAQWRQRIDPRDTIEGLVNHYALIQEHLAAYDPEGVLGLEKTFGFFDTDLMDCMAWLAGLRSSVTMMPSSTSNFFLACSNHLLRTTMGIPVSDEERELFLKLVGVKESLPNNILRDRAKMLGVIESEEEIEILVRRSEQNWEMRENSSFFENYGRYSGYKASNYLDLDFYLAAAIKKIGWDGETIHKWVW